MPFPHEHGATLRTALAATASTLALHTLCAMAVATPQVLAPVAARSFGLQPSRVGLLIAFYYVFLMPAGLMVGPLLARFGIRRVCQLTAALIASGLVLGAANGLFAAATPPGETPGLLAALFALLLFGATGIVGLGYGLINPIGSQIVFLATPAAYRSMMFSIKQSAVPIGGALAGVFFPAALALMDWYWSVALVGAVIAASAFAMRAAWFHEQGFDDARQDAQAHRPFRVRAEDFTGPVRLILSRPRLRELAFAGTCYNANQIALVTFTIAYLNLEIGLSLVASGAIFSAGQAAGMIGRILWGVVADRWVAPRKLLGALGIVAALSSMSFAAFSPGWPLAALFALSFLAGGTAVSWNGVFLAEVARLAPTGETGKITGGIQLFIALGGMSGPALFSLLLAAGGTYAISFLALGVPCFLAGLRLLMPARTPPAPAQS